MRAGGDHRPMTELTLTLLRLGYLALLWIFVLSVVAVLRSDIYGTRVTRRATANKFDHNRLADCFSGELGVHVLHSRDRMRAERDQQVADHDTGLVRGAVWFHFDHNGGSFLIALQRLPERLG